MSDEYSLISLIGRLKNAEMAYIPHKKVFGYAKSPSMSKPFLSTVCYAPHAFIIKHHYQVQLTYIKLNGGGVNS